MARLAVARLWFCSNSFTPRRTRAEDVQAHEWAAGPIALPLSATADGELDGVRAFISSRPGWDVTMLRCASALPGGPLSAELFGAWMAEVEDSLRRGRFDAVYLSLHGACQAEGDPAVDVTILRRVRSIVGHTPVVATFDMRANMSEEIAILLDGASANQVWPSGGRAEAASRVLGMLEATLAGRFRPVGALARVPMLLSDFVLPDALGDIASTHLHDLRPPVIEASVFGGFAWGDSPYAGPSALVWADRDAGAAREMAAHMAVSLTRWRNRPVPAITSIEASLQAAAALLAEPNAGAAGSQPALLLDPSDDPASGGLADTPELLRAVLLASAQQRITGRALFAVLHDPEISAAACAGGVGARIDFTLGGRSTPLYGAGVPVTALVHAARTISPIGGFAVLRVGMVDILVVAVRPLVITPVFLAQVGLDTAQYRLLAVKGGVIAQTAFTGQVASLVLCDCPGPASPDLTRLPFHYVPALRRSRPPEMPPPPTHEERRNPPHATSLR